MPITEDRIREFPAVRITLTDEQAAQVAEIADANPDKVLMIAGWCGRHRWPDPEKFSCVAWAIPPEDLEKAMKAGGILASRPLKKPCRRK